MDSTDAEGEGLARALSRFGLTGFYGRSGGDFSESRCIYGIMERTEGWPSG
jgi:hypothetical protein